MDIKPNARIVSCNQYGEPLAASAARISTTPGNAMEIFEAAKTSDKNTGLIQKVLRSGHCSTMEHAVFTVALWDVSVFVEEFFIEFRLASFTVKSRRYVDFGGQGYHIPAELEGERRALYCRYMDGLFDAYGRLLEHGVPKEDARFLLPYAFHSSFYCTLNARELVHLIQSARSRGIPELSEVAVQLAQQLLELFPAAAGLLTGEPSSQWAGWGTEDGCALVKPGAAGSVTLLQSPQQPEKLLDAAWNAAHPGEPFPGADALVLCQRARELEQLTYTFAIHGLTLAGLTHLVRHRMQSVAVPPLERISRGRIILPDSVSANPDARKIYEDAVERACELRGRLCEDPGLWKYDYYYLLSGTLTDVVTTMNARELRLFLRLRTCSRAQWEIRSVALRTLSLLRPTFPALFRRMGPACCLFGACSEGAMSCGRAKEMQQRFSRGEL